MKIEGEDRMEIVKKAFDLEKENSWDQLGFWEGIRLYARKISDKKLEDEVCGAMFWLEHDEMEEAYERVHMTPPEC